MSEQRYPEANHLPPHGYARTGILTAVKVALRYHPNVPTVPQLRRDFGMSRATAYRWRNAFIEARNGIA